MVEQNEDETTFLALRRAETIGRPLGNAAFLAHLEAHSGRSLAPGKRGRKPKSGENY